MKKPPVFYSLIQVRFNRITQMQQYVPAFQEALRREGFPDFTPETQLEVQIMQSATGQPNVEQRRSQRWIFNDLDRTSGFVLLEDTLVYHTTSYTRFSDCRQRVLHALQLLHELLEINYIQRVGMRYLDAFVPTAGKKLEDYVLPELLGLSQMSLGNLQHSYSETVQTVGDATLVLKAFTAPGKLPMPPDLQQLALEVPERLKQITAGPCLVMDSDCFSEKRFAYDEAHIEKCLNNLHANLLQVFKQSTNEKARAQWEA